MGLGIVFGYIAASGRLDSLTKLRTEGELGSRQAAIGPLSWPRLPVQEMLPFPPTSSSIAGRTMQDSVYKQRVESRSLPKDAPDILIALIDDVGPGAGLSIRTSIRRWT
jgi:hypothetical protein